MLVGESIYKWPPRCKTGSGYSRCSGPTRTSVAALQDSGRPEPAQPQARVPAWSSRSIH